MSDQPREKCSNCRWWREILNVEVRQVGLGEAVSVSRSTGSGPCVRHAPRPVVLAEEGRTLVRAVWPITNETDDCGDHEWRVP